MFRKDKALEILRHARRYAARVSKDESTKTATWYVHPTEYGTIARGYNGQPQGARDHLAERQARPLKYVYAEHGERNGIYNAVRPQLEGSIVVCVDKHMTMSSFRAIASVGAVEVWLPSPSWLPELESESGPEADARQYGISLLKEVGVRVGYFDEAGKVLEESRKWAACRTCRKVEDYVFCERSLAFEMSKDPKAGASVFLARDSFRVLAEGYSGFPRGADDSQEGRYLGADRHFWVEGSVQNAIFNLARPILRGSIAHVTEMPCAECLRAMYAVAVAEVHAVLPEEQFAERWAVSMAASSLLAEELGLPVKKYTKEETAPAELPPLS